MPEKNKKIKKIIIESKKDADTGLIPTDYESKIDVTPLTRQPSLIGFDEFSMFMTQENIKKLGIQNNI